MPSFSFKCLKKLVRFFYIKYTVDGTENLPDEPTIIVGNHSQINGPLFGELYCPNEPYIWCAWQMMVFKEAPNYTYKDFWSFKPRASKWFYRLVSFLIAPISVFIFNNARTIPVYHDMRLISTFKATINKLEDGKNVLIFPEKNQTRNNIIYEFQDKFIDIAKLYYKKTGKELTFTPLYIAPKLKKAFIGKPIKFNSLAPIEDERRRICDALMEEITNIGKAAPIHTVVPYRNVPKKEYKKNK
jgi:hypothetical protein